MRKSAKQLPYILAALNQEDQEADERPTTQPLPDGEDQEEILHAYPVNIGGVQGVLHTKEELPPEYFTDSKVIDNQEDLAPQPEAQPLKEASFFPHFFLILCFFLMLDNVSNTIPILLTPTAIITIIPKAQQITFTGSLPLGRILSPLTISQSQTIPTTGHGHQTATQAIGILTFYNAAFTTQTIPAGSVFTGSDGIQIATSAAVTIPANNPPSDGEAQVSAQAVYTGAIGNIPALSINTAFSASLYVKNLAPFTGGLDERDFSVVTKTDINTTAATLTGKVTASMNAAFQQQLFPTEQSEKLACHPTVTADHAIGNEAVQVMVTVSETCTIVAYDTGQLTARATHLLTTQASKQLGAGYNLYGTVQVNITKVATRKPNTVLLFFTSRGTWVYSIDQQSILHLIAGKPRQQGLHLLTSLPGIRRVAITGIADNDPLPEDPGYIHFQILIGL